MIKFEIRDFSKLNILELKNITKIKLIDLIDKETFIETFKNDIFDYSIGGNSTEIIGKIVYSDFLNEKKGFKYIFHNSFTDRQIFNKLIKLVPLIETKRKMRISRIYSGSSGTGTNFHTHSVAINYLISGLKIWFIFPNTNNNISLIRKIKGDYGHVKKNTVDYLLDNKKLLINNIENLSIIFQEEGTAIMIPEFWYHAVVNVTDVIGITYSWY
jgi:hypothetical protein